MIVSGPLELGAYELQTSESGFYVMAGMLVINVVSGLCSGRDIVLLGRSFPGDRLLRQYHQRAGQLQAIVMR